MKNKIKFKKYIITTLGVSLVLMIAFLLINVYEYNKYTVNFNRKISGIVGVIQDKYPDINENDIMEILNSEEKTASSLFDEYGIDIDRDSIVLKNERDYHKFLILNSALLLIVIGTLLVIFLRYNKKRDLEINDITKCIEEINRGNYSLNIDSISEDELSILRNEIYKTTIKLKEACNNSSADKINLKKSLEDISHQLKTPLTSILVMLDNLIDDPNMDSSVRNDFIMDIKRSIININFLVQAILKLSKFDSNTVNFIRSEVSIKSIVDEAIKNVSVLCDLRNINVDVQGGDECLINCDFKWQCEAVTNILKNAIDHSYEGNRVLIKYEDFNVYSMITIKDFGDGISKKDMAHIFDRFYKGENATPDSMGIGLALSKSIIDEDNGVVSVDSNKNGTCFTIKYFKL